MDPYVYPGTNVLQNLRNLRDPDQLGSFEANATARRGTELAARSPNGAFDAAHVQAIHRYLFQDVYEWAGELRSVNISRAGRFPYAFPQQIAPSLHNLASALRKERFLAGIAPAAFCQRAGYYLGELNAIHPFRDGNGRTQREFIRQLAARNGHTLEWSRVSREQVYEASARSFQHGDNAGLEQLLRSALSPDRHKEQPSRDHDRDDR